jgi:hypothetical protein
MAELKDDPGEKMRTLLAGGKSSPLGRLPKNANVVIEKKANEPTTQPPIQNEAPHASRTPKAAAVSKGVGFNFGPPFWTIASTLSLIVNVILIIILLVVWMGARALNLGGVVDIGNGLLGGLYTNFEKMDNAHITRTVPVDTTIPVKFDLVLNQQTNVVLSQDVTINNALVTVKTGGMNITNALTTIVLPQGSTLPVFLNLTVPVDQMVPVSLKVEVDIPLAETQLHEPFSGLQDVVKPFYCMLNPVALRLDGKSVCK